jgi:hypothetical protein
MLGSCISLGLVIEKLVDPDGSGGRHLNAPYYICRKAQNSPQSAIRQQIKELKFRHTPLLAARNFP